MNLTKGKLGFLLLILILTFLATGCDFNRSDAKVVSEVFFRAFMAKDKPQLQQVIGSDDSLPSGQMWNDVSFIKDNTQGEMIKQLWKDEAIKEYTLIETIVDDYQRPTYRTSNPYTGYPPRPLRSEKLVHIQFVLADKRLNATITLEKKDNEWYPAWNPAQSGDYLIKFE